MKDANMNQAPRWEYEEIDLYQCIKIFIKRIRIFAVVVLLFLAMVSGYILLSPKTYRATILLQSSVSTESALPTAEDIESAKYLKALIISGAFDEAVGKRLNLYPHKSHFKFDVMIPNKTNILQIGIDMERNKKEFGAVVLQNLADLISEKYAKQAASKPHEIANQIEINETSVKKGIKEIDGLQKQINEALDQESALRKKAKALNAEMAQSIISQSADYSFKDKLREYDELNDRLGALSTLKYLLCIDIRNINRQISYYQLKIEGLHSEINFIRELKILSQPKVSFRLIGGDQAKVLSLIINVGILLGISAVFIQEFLANKHGGVS